MTKEITLTNGKIIEIRNKNTSRKYKTGMSVPCGSYGISTILGQCTEKSSDGAYKHFIIQTQNDTIIQVRRTIFTSKHKYNGGKRKVTPKHKQEPINKVCAVCRESKPITAFSTCGGHNSLGIPYRRNQCRDCYSLMRSRNKADYIKEKQYIQELHELHVVGKRRCRHCLTIKNEEEFPADFSSKCYYNLKSYCKECAKNKWQKAYRSSTHYRNKKAQWDKTYRTKHKEKINSHYNYRRKNSPTFRLLTNLRNSFNKNLTRKGTNKNNKTLQYIGCSKEDLILHLNAGEYTMVHYMEGINQGKGFHIDHIIPSKYYLNKIEVDEEGNITPETEPWLYKWWNYRNLRVWPAVDNIIKGDTLDMGLVKEHQIEDLL